jgi:uracil-DNA glycosylase
MAKPRPHFAPAEIVISGEGDPQAKLVFLTAKPSEKAANDLLHKMIEAMGLKTSEVFVAHLSETGPLKLGNLPTQIVIALGNDFHVTAAKNAKLVTTFHPEDLIQKPELKKQVWAILQNVAKELGIAIPSRK